MWTDIVLPIVTLWPIFTGVGALIDWMIEYKSKKVSEFPHRLFVLGLWYLMGAAVVTMGQFLLSLVHIPLIDSLVLFGFVALVGFGVQVKRKFKFSYTCFAFILATPILALFFIRSFSRTMYTWDSTAFWMPKMFALWRDQKVTVKTFEFFNHPEYPLLLPTVGADTMTVFNAPNEIAVKVTLFGFTLALIAMMDGFFAAKTSFIKRVLALFFFLSLFVVREHMAGEYVGTADVLVGTYIAAGTIMLLLKKQHHALLLWATVPWVKSEGLVWMLSSIGLTGLIYIKTLMKNTWKLVIPAVLATSWFIYTKVVGLSSSQYFKFDEIYARPWVEYFVYSIHSFREEFRNIQKWNLLFFFFLSSMFVSVKKILKDKDAMIIMVSLFAQLCSYLLIFTITPEEQATFIAAAISRLSLHLAPTVLLMTIYVWRNKEKEKHG